VPAPAAAPASAGPATLIQLTVTDVEGEVRLIEVDSNETVDNVAAILEVEFGVPHAQQQLFFEGRLLQRGARIDSAGVKNGDMLMLQRAAPRAAPSAPPARAGAGAPPGGLSLGGLGQLLGNINPMQRYLGEAQQLLQAAAQDPHLLTRVRDNNPALHNALASGSPEAVAKELLELEKAKRESELKKAAAIARLNANPLDVAPRPPPPPSVLTGHVSSLLPY